MTLVQGLPYAGADRREGATLLLAGHLIVIGTVLFNFGLAIVNRNVLGISSLWVMGAEAMLLGSAWLLILANYRAAMTKWVFLLGFISALILATWMWKGWIDPKPVRDLAIGPTFVCLGLALGARRLPRLVLILQAIVLGVLLLEWFATDRYSALLGVRDYYIATRGLSEAAFWNEQSDLFVSATRPNERHLLPSLNIHRLSSVFLEPVSLGNYVVIVTAFILACARGLSASAILFLVGTNLMLLVGSDGRLAIAICALLLTFSVFAARLPTWTSLSYLPAATLGCFALLYLGGAVPGSDDFLGRPALTAAILDGLTPLQFLGLSNDHVPGIFDSGLIYMILNFTIIGAIALWCFICVAGCSPGGSARLYTHGFSLYVALTLMVSYSLFSIKTAALAWFLLGALTRGWDENPRGASANRADA